MDSVSKRIHSPSSRDSSPLTEMNGLVEAGASERDSALNSAVGVENGCNYDCSPGWG